MCFPALQIDIVLYVHCLATYIAIAAVTTLFCNSKLMHLINVLLRGVAPHTSVGLLQLLR